MTQLSTLHSQLYEQIKNLKPKVNTIVSGQNGDVPNAVTTSLSSHSVNKSPSVDSSMFYNLSLPNIIVVDLIMVFHEFRRLEIFDNCDFQKALQMVQCNSFRHPIIRYQKEMALPVQ